MSFADSDTLDYFQLIALCAQKLETERPINEHPQVFWRRTVGNQWRNTYQHMTRPVDGGVTWRTNAYKQELALKFAALSRLAAMAAWMIGGNDVEGESPPDDVLKYFENAGTLMAPIIR